MALTLFQNITAQLTPLEKQTIVPLLLDTLAQTHEGNRFTGKVLCNYFKACRYEVSEVRLRKMMNYIRVMNLVPGKVVIGAGNGYYVTSDVHHIEDQIESLQGRIDSQAAVIDSMKAQLLSIKKLK